MCPVCASTNLKYYTEGYYWDFSADNPEYFWCLYCDARGTVADLYNLPDDEDFWQACEKGRWVEPV